MKQTFVHQLLDQSYLIMYTMLAILGAIRRLTITLNTHTNYEADVCTSATRPKLFNHVHNA